MSADSGKKTFFRQSGWMVSTTLSAGVCMAAVHIFGPMMADGQYALFGTLLAMLNVLGIPSAGLQTTITQQTAAAVTPEGKARLVGTTQVLLAATFLIWLVVAGSALLFQREIMELFTIPNPSALWLIIALGLMSLWGPIISGIVQGQQNFLWMGWAQIANGAGRFLAVAIIVGLLGGQATGAMAGALIGVTIATLICMVQSRGVWASRERLPCAWKAWLADVIPLTLACGSFQFLFSIDMLVVRNVFGENMTGYTPSGTLARGLIMVTTPLTMVMFPKIVHNVSLGKKSNILMLTMLTTLAMGVLAAIACTLIALGLQNFASHSESWQHFMPAVAYNKLVAEHATITAIGSLLPWFVWCILPQTAANVLLGNVMARKQYRVVPYLVLVVVAYAIIARVFGNSLVRVIQILGCFNLLFLGVLIGFTWGGRSKTDALA